MDLIPLCRAVPCLLKHCSPPHPPHSIAGVPNAVITPETGGLGLKDIGHVAPGEPMGVRAKPFVHNREDKVMGTRLDRLKFRRPWDSQGEPAHASRLLLLRNQ